MTERLIDILLRLSARERALIVFLVVAVLPAALYLGWIRPLVDDRNAAQAAVQEAHALRVWVEERSAESLRLSLTLQGVETAPIGVSGIEKSLVAAGLRSNLSELTRRGEEEILLRFDTVPFVDLGQWINTTSLSWGYDITGLRIERGEEPGLVAASLVLAPKP